MFNYFFTKENQINNNMETTSTFLSVVEMIVIKWKESMSSRTLLLINVLSNDRVDVNKIAYSG